jgi:DDE family transposase
VFGLARNKRLEPMLADALGAAKATFESIKQAQRVFKELTYRTKDSWSRQRRGWARPITWRRGANPRFIVTSLSAERIDGKELTRASTALVHEKHGSASQHRHCLPHRRRPASGESYHPRRCHGGQGPL